VTVQILFEIEIEEVSVRDSSTEFDCALPVCVSDPFAQEIANKYKCRRRVTFTFTTNSALQRLMANPSGMEQQYLRFG
jgi:hypothetical protein